MPRYLLAILKNETDTDHQNWVEACEKYSGIVEYNIIDLVAENWVEKITEKKYDYALLRSPGSIAYYKQLYDERVYIINKVLNIPIYPTFIEQHIYENKRLLSYFLKSGGIPHPRTWVFYRRDEAVTFINKCKFPIVAKTSIGASGRGVEILRNSDDALRYIDNSFSEGGVKRSYFPNFRRGNYVQRLQKRMSNIGESIEYFKEKKKDATIEPQKWFVIFQEYIKAEYEWRCVVINDSYFGHKKLPSFGEKMSGTSKVSWDIPDEELLYFLKDIVDRNGFWSQAIDLFFDRERGYLVNELQCFWGSKNPHQMIKDGKPGRFVYRDNRWVFEEGVFNQNNSYDLRLKHILELLEKVNEETV
jgi:glutathione synthase/RimK-type ligase-like ATP-grasp enzyme